MKRIITILFVGFCLTSFAQSKKMIKAEGLINPDLRYLYIGVDNSISLENNNDTNVFLSITEGKCWKGRRENGKDYYNIFVSSRSNKNPLKILRKTSTDTILLDTANFAVLRVADPTAIFGNLVDSIATVDALMLQNEIKIFMPCYYRLGFHVTSYTLTITRVDGSTERINSLGNLLRYEQKQLIKSLKPGDILYIEDIKCIPGGGCTRSLAAIKIRVKLR